jgi:hypothetical protein
MLRIPVYNSLIFSVLVIIGIGVMFAVFHGVGINERKELILKRCVIRGRSACLNCFKTTELKSSGLFDDFLSLDKTDFTGSHLF